MNNASWKTVDIPTHPIKGGRWIEVIAEIRLNSTGEIRKHITNQILMDDETEPSVFNWKENNYSCDCNREIFFMRASGVDDDDIPDTDCTDGRYSVRLINPVTNTVYYSEF